MILSDANIEGLWFLLGGYLESQRNAIKNDTSCCRPLENIRAFGFLIHSTQNQILCVLFAIYFFLKSSLWIAIQAFFKKKFPYMFIYYCTCKLFSDKKIVVGLTSKDMIYFKSLHVLFSLLITSIQFKFKINDTLIIII